jgi:hypothetical protein
MSVPLLCDENVRGFLPNAIERKALLEGVPVDVVSVGDAENLPFGSTDAAILEWAAQEGRVLITLDKSTVPAVFRERMNQGFGSAGVLMMRHHASIRDVVEYLVLVACLGTPPDYRDRLKWFP